MAEVLVTGGSGVLGTAVVPVLRAAGHRVRVLSRTAGDARVVGDLATGAGIAAAVAGVEIIVHAASSPGRHARAVDVEGTDRLVTAARDAGVGHLLHVSITGVDRIPYSYYQAKFAAEQVVAGSGIPYTVLRAAQFHPFVALLLAGLHRVPVLPVPRGWRLEPVAAADVAERVNQRVAAGPAGAVEEFAGPEVLTLGEVARAWLAARHRPALVVGVPVPGRVSAALRAGANLVAADAPRGRLTWESWLASPAVATELAQYRRRR